MPRDIILSINGKPHTVAEGTNLAVALAQAQVPHFRRSPAGQPRTAFCGMGTCFECRVTIDGRPHQRSCQVVCRDGMEVCTDE